MLRVNILLKKVCDLRLSTRRVSKVEKDVSVTYEGDSLSDT